MATEKKLDVVILGLLSHENMSGYDIKKRIENSLSLFWGASYGSIYPTLKELVNKGLATRADELDKGREKAVYSITDRGKKHLASWLEQPASRDEIRYESLLKVFFGSQAGTKQAIEHIQRLEANAKVELGNIKSSIANLEAVLDSDENHLYYLLTAKFGEMFYTACIDWCCKSNEILEKIGGGN
ncbi:MAG: PadR family transcriptional regulator [Eubacteriaceae bacterium]|jgi:DNA-binding PadR family transcriptional regulator|nr:PadR family transcriptional regulator [Eubacteriaceae bacterium]